MGVPAAPPPPPPPMLGGSSSAPAPLPAASVMEGRDALLKDIRKGMKLKSVQTNDRSAPMVGGKVSSTGGSTASTSIHSSASGTGPGRASGNGPTVPSGVPQLGDILAGGLPKLRHSSGAQGTSAPPIPAGAPPIPGNAPPVPSGRPPTSTPAKNSPAAPAMPSSRPSRRDHGMRNSMLSAQSVSSTNNVTPGSPQVLSSPAAAPPVPPSAAPPVPSTRPSESSRHRLSIPGTSSVQSASGSASVPVPAPAPAPPPPPPTFGAPSTPSVQPSASKEASPMPGVLPFLAEINARRSDKGVVDDSTPRHNPAEAYNEGVSEHSVSTQAPLGAPPVPGIFATKSLHKSGSTMSTHETAPPQTSPPRAPTLAAPPLPTTAPPPPTIPKTAKPSSTSLPAAPVPAIPSVPPPPPGLPEAFHSSSKPKSNKSAKSETQAAPVSAGPLPFLAEIQKKRDDRFIVGGDTGYTTKVEQTDVSAKDTVGGKIATHSSQQPSVVPPLPNSTAPAPPIPGGMSLLGEIESKIHRQHPKRSNLGGNNMPSAAPAIPVSPPPVPGISTESQEVHKSHMPSFLSEVESSIHRHHRQPESESGAEQTAPPLPAATAPPIPAGAPPLPTSAPPPPSQSSTRRPHKDTASLPSRPPPPPVTVVQSTHAPPPPPPPPSSSSAAAAVVSFNEGLSSDYAPTSTQSTIQRGPDRSNMSPTKQIKGRLFSAGSSTASTSEIKADSYVLNVTNGSVSTGTGSRVLEIDDSRFNFSINAAQIPAPRKFQKVKHLYPGGTGSTVPLDLSQFR